MLFLQFRIGEEWLALAAGDIEEIVPLTALRPVRGEGLSFDYRGRFIPAVDLSLRETGIPARRWLSTRILVVQGRDGDLLGLVAEQAATMLRLDPADFAPFAKGPQGLVQRVELADLLPAAQGAAA
jgi:chemotaxis-related protein WspB